MNGLDANSNELLAAIIFIDTHFSSLKQSAGRCRREIVFLGSLLYVPSKPDCRKRPPTQLVIYLVTALIKIYHPGKPGEIHQDDSVTLVPLHVEGLMVEKWINRP